jgi:hypothetical protein
MDVQIRPSDQKDCYDLVSTKTGKILVYAESFIVSNNIQIELIFESDAFPDSEAAEVAASIIRSGEI